MATKEGMKTNFPPSLLLRFLDPGFEIWGPGSGRNIPDPQHWFFLSRFFTWFLFCHNIMPAILLQKLSGKVASILKRFIDWRSSNWDTVSKILESSLYYRWVFLEQFHKGQIFKLQKGFQEKKNMLQMSWVNSFILKNLSKPLTFNKSLNLKKKRDTK